MTNLKRPEKAKIAALRLTDFDHAVLAAARMNMLKVVKTLQKPKGFRSVVLHHCYMGDICVDQSIKRLERAGQLLTTPSILGNVNIIFPDDQAWYAVQHLKSLRRP